MARLIEELGVSEYVLTTGYVSEEELVALYNLADVFVYPSLFEGFGLPILESMACGTPVIASCVTSMPEVAGDAGYLVEPESEEQVQAAIERLAHDDALRERMRAKGLKHAATFSWRKVAKQTMDVYRRVA